jgi:hypothetical protein
LYITTAAMKVLPRPTTNTRIYLVQTVTEEYNPLTLTIMKRQSIF